MNTTSADRSYWTINDTTIHATKIFGPTKPLNLVEYYDNAGTDTFSITIQFFHFPSAGFYSVINYNEFAQSFEVDGNVHVKVRQGSKIYRNYKQPVQKLEVIDSAGNSVVKITGLFLYNAADISDSISVNANVMLGNSGNANWSVNGTLYNSSLSFYYFRDWYEWQFIDTISSKVFTLNLPSIPNTEGTIGITFFISYKPHKAWWNLFPLPTSKMMKDQDTNRTAIVKMLPGEINVTMKDYLVLVAPYNVDSFLTITHWPDTMRVSANLFFPNN